MHAFGSSTGNVNIGLNSTCCHIAVLCSIKFASPLENVIAKGSLT
jgi:hypothetical protein